MPRINVKHDRSICIYDTVRKCPIGVFDNLTILADYLYGKFRAIGKTSNLHSALARRGRLLSTDLNVPIALRFANEEQEAALGDEIVFMYDESLKAFDKTLLNKMSMTGKAKDLGKFGKRQYTSTTKPLIVS